MIDLVFYRTHKDVPVPFIGTSLSTCFDLCFSPKDEYISLYTNKNLKIERKLNSDRSFLVMPGDRVLAPTGLVMKVVPHESTKLHEYSIRLHPRSGISLKKGLILANCEGIVDIDYQEEIFALMINTSSMSQVISFNERICQAEVVKNKSVFFIESSEKPEKYSERSGGFGSTGSV